MTTNGRNTESGNAFCQRAGAAFLNGCLQSLKGLFAEAVGLNDRVAVLLQLVQIRKRMNPAVSDQLFQRRLRQTFHVHSAFVAEVDEFLYQLCRAASIFAKKLMRPTGRFSNLQRCTAAGAGHGKRWKSDRSHVVL